MLKDSDVGRIWRKLRHDCYDHELCQQHGDQFRLIRSLVEERAKHCGGLEAALSDFGIDLEEWETLTKI